MTKGRSSTLRKHRIDIAGGVYHIRFSTDQRKPLFCFTAGRIIAPILNAVSARYEVKLLCWIIMPDHLHLLVQLPNQLSLSFFVQKLKGDCSRSLRRSLDLELPVWQDGFYDRAIRKEDDIKTIARYIVANPIRAGLVRSVRQYALWDAVWLSQAYCS